MEHRKERQQRDLLPRERGRRRDLLERSRDAGAGRRRASGRPVAPDGCRRRLRPVSVARRGGEARGPVEPGAHRGERQPRRALAQRREGCRVRAGQPGLGSQGEGEQVRPACALRTQRRGLHRLARARVPSGVPQHQDPGAAVSVRARLSAMMFLQFFIWGAWYTTIAVYMTHHGMETLTHWPYTVNPIAAIVAPFFLGLVADRYFATERVLGSLHLLGGIIMLLVPGATGTPTLFLGLLLLSNLCYMPTLGLVNSLAFHHIQNQEKQFPLIRVFGTIGWIVAGLFIGFVLSRFTGGQLPDTTVLPLYTTAVASLILGLYSFSLPHTPPPAAGRPVSIRSIVGLDALRELGSKPFYIFVISSMLICFAL